LPKQGPSIAYRSRKRSLFQKKRKRGHKNSIFALVNKKLNRQISGKEKRRLRNQKRKTGVAAKKIGGGKKNRKQNLFLTTRGNGARTNRPTKKKPIDVKKTKKKKKTEGATP